MAGSRDWTARCATGLPVPNPAVWCEIRTLRTRRAHAACSSFAKVRTGFLLPNGRSRLPTCNRHFCNTTLPFGPLFSSSPGFLQRLPAGKWPMLTSRTATVGGYTQIRAQPARIFVPSFSSPTTPISGFYQAHSPLSPLARPACWCESFAAISQPWACFTTS